MIMARLVYGIHSSFGLSLGCYFLLKKIVTLQSSGGFDISAIDSGPPAYSKSLILKTV